MTNMTTDEQVENFAELLEQSFAGGDSAVGGVTQGLVVRLENEFAIVDVGLKSEGRVALREFANDEAGVPKVGDSVGVYVERMEDKNGEIVLSRERALREALWIELEAMNQKGEQVTGRITHWKKWGNNLALHVNASVKLKLKRYES